MGLFFFSLYPSSIGLVFDNIINQTNKLNCAYITLYNCTVHSTTRYRAQLARRRQRERTLPESEVVTYEHVNEVVRKRCVKHKAKRWDSRATLLLIADSVGALIVLIIK